MPIMEVNPRGLRKGTWTKEEDILLTQCVEKYGEGKWHQVPLRAGLNRCRKSCRLRWLNYLRPNIKRGCFSEDEVDLIVRLHKLLGNKWTLIAGRLPERTANDVKNFWNTHIAKNPDQAVGDRQNKNAQKMKNLIIKPKPRTLSKLHETLPNEVRREANKSSHNSNQKPISYDDAALSSQEQVNENIRWWSKLLETTENGEPIHPLLEVQQKVETSSESRDDDDYTTNGVHCVFSIDDLHVWDVVDMGDK